MRMRSVSISVLSKLCKRLVKPLVGRRKIKSKKRRRKLLRIFGKCRRKITMGEFGQCDVSTELKNILITRRRVRLGM